MFFNIFKGRGRHALVTDKGVFRNCSLEKRNIGYAVLDSSEAERRQIWHDIKAIEDLDAERCIVVGSLVKMSMG